MPLLRYRTRDLTRITKEPCVCGRTLARMDKVMGRSDDMLKIKGVNVFPSQIESVLMPIEQIGPHYMLYIRKEGLAQTLEVEVELIDGSLLERYSDLEALTAPSAASCARCWGWTPRSPWSAPKPSSVFLARPSAWSICASNKERGVFL